MSEFYSEEPLRYPNELPALANGEIRGHAWNVKPVGEEYVLSFISGALQSCEISLSITNEEYRGLAAGTLSIETIQRKYGTG